MTDTVMSFLASDGVENRIEYHNRDYQFYNGKHDFSAFLGFSEKALNSIQITFNREGLYSFDRMYVSCTPSSQYKEGIRELKEDYLQDLVIGNNFFSGTIRLKSDKYLLLSVPYSEGWTALVDGKKAKLLKGNGCYCALKLSEGFHEIKMTYRTPYLRQGARFSAAALLAYVFSVLRVERKKRGRR